ncbi:ATP-binding protein [Spirulina sp. 06S082]|uniref:sensor histidine kinase n=1 Tax=Spirulina sp. 06S082 TaxID=3110248 RepID=UPI002B208496|nr:ATP-binding protein [Spirulina sp. 06S082]MEA5468990.1 ATP-binding protein [Spirulina sp. 06S082]
MNAAATSIHSLNWQDLGAELIFTQDISGKYLSFYWKFAPEYGLNPEQIIGHHWRDIFTPTDAESYQETLMQVVEKRRPQNFYCFFVWKEEALPFELSVTPILRSQSPITSVLVIGSLLDKNAIAKSPQSSQNSSQIIPEDNYQEFITQVARNIHRNPYQNLLSQISRTLRITLDAETIWQETARKLGQELGVSRVLMISCHPNTKVLKVETEYCKQPFKSLLRERLDTRREPYLQQALQTDEPIAIDCVETALFEQKSVLVVSAFYQNKRNALICLQQCDRYRHWNNVEIELMRELADLMGIAIAHANLYKQAKQASEEAAEASRLKSEFLAGTSHELRTPLNGIINFLKFILDDMADDPEEEREFVEQAHKSALHLLNLINDVLDLARIEAGKMEVNFVRFSLNNTFIDLDKKMRPLAEKQGLNFEIQLPETQESIFLYGSHQRLLQVLLNLVGNAIKFTHEGGVTIDVDITRKKVVVNDRECPGMARIRVADTGIGVPLDKQDTLFQKFAQVSGGRTRSYGGTGLGLSISQTLVELMGGKINFFSMGENLGSTVTFTVPLFEITSTG